MILLEYTPIPIGSTVVVLGETSGPWMYGAITDHGDNNYNGRSYGIVIMKTVSKQSGKYICRDDLYRNYAQNLCPSRVTHDIMNAHIQTMNINTKSV